MESNPEIKTYIAFFRGINVGGHHKVPMARLREEIEKIGYSGIVTLLNSGNVILRSEKPTAGEIQQHLSSHLKEVFAFEIPTLVLEGELFKSLFATDPFSEEELTEHTRCYITFVGNIPIGQMELPLSSADGSFKILSQRGQTLCSVLDLNKTGTPKAMSLLENMYGKGITTRNWNTIDRILKKLNAMEIQ